MSAALRVANSNVGATNQSTAETALTPRDRAAMAVMVSGGLWMALIFTAIAPVLSTMSEALGGGIGGYWIGQLTMTMPDIGIIVGSPIAGLLVERFCARALLFASFVVFGIAGASGLFIENSIAMLAMRLLLGFSGAGIATSTTALIGVRFSGETRIRALGYWSAVGAGGGMISILVAGRIAAAAGWRAAFGLYLVIFLALALGLVTLPADPKRTELAKKFEVPSIWPLWRIYAGMVPLYVAVFMTGVQASFLLSADAITSPIAQSWIIGAASAGSAVGAWSFGYTRPKIGAPNTLMLLICALAAGNLLMPATRIAGLIAVGCALVGFGGGMANPYCASVLLERAPIAARGRAIGFLYTAMFFGEFMNPFVITPLRQLAGIHGAFLVVSGALGAAALFIAVGRIKHSRKSGSSI